MTLYSADVLDLAKPVSKKGKGKKVEEVVEPVEPVPEPVKEKKAPTEKQLAALAKAQESRKRKREEAEAAKVALDNAEKARAAAEEEKQKTAEAKKEAAREKRRAKKQILPSPAESMDEEIDRAVQDIAPPTKKVKIAKEPVQEESGPPAWFKQYVAGVKKEEAKISHEKKPKKQIQKEAEDHAHKNWSDSFTRDRVRNEVDGHMSRMYQMMFTGRRLK